MALVGEWIIRPSTSVTPAAVAVAVAAQKRNALSSTMLHERPLLPSFRRRCWGLPVSLATLINYICIERAVVVSGRKLVGWQICAQSFRLAVLRARLRLVGLIRALAVAADFDHFVCLGGKILYLPGKRAGELAGLLLSC